MNLLIIDTETTGIDENLHNAIEVAAILYNLESKQILQQASTLVRVNDNSAEKINKIPAELSKKCNEKPVIDAIKIMAENAGAIVAHNAEFDKKFIGKCGLSCLEPMHWICSYRDIDYECGQSSLVQLALNHDVPVVSAHRALTDCIILANIFSKIDNLDEIIKESMKPRSIYVANISFEDRQIAKDHGFVWNGIIEKKWAKKITKEQAQKIPFKISEVKK